MTSLLTSVSAVLLARWKRKEDSLLKWKMNRRRKGADSQRSSRDKRELLVDTVLQKSVKSKDFWSVSQKVEKLFGLLSFFSSLKKKPCVWLFACRGDRQLSNYCPCGESETLFLSGWFSALTPCFSSHASYPCCFVSLLKCMCVVPNISQRNVPVDGQHQTKQCWQGPGLNVATVALWQVGFTHFKKNSKLLLETIKCL